MRRRLAVLSLAAAAAVVPTAPAAHAEPLCYRVASLGGKLPDVETNFSCIDYAYGVVCHSYHYWDDGLKLDVWVEFCFPRIID